MPAANHHHCYSSDSEQDDESGEGEEEQERTPGQSCLFHVDIHGMSTRKQVQQQQGPNDLSDSSCETPPIKPGDKWQSNVKPPVTNKVIYVYENTTFINMLVAVIWESFLCRDLLVSRLDEDRRLRPDTPFTLEYLIPHNTVFKDIELALENDWEMFVEKMKDMAKRSRKLTIKEKVTQFTSCSLTKLISYRPMKQLKHTQCSCRQWHWHILKEEKEKGEWYLQIWFH